MSSKQPTPLETPLIQPATDSTAEGDTLLYLSQPSPPSTFPKKRHGYSPLRNGNDYHEDNDQSFDGSASSRVVELLPPKDNWNIAYFIFFALGVGMLFPWNVFINANEYFRARLEGSQFVDNYANFFSIGYMVSNVLWLAITLRTQANAKPMLRIMNALILNALIFLSCIVLTRLKNIPAQIDFALNMSMVVICGASTAYLQNGVFGLVSVFPSIYVQAVMSGQGLAGSAVALSQIFTLFAKSHEDKSVEAASYSAFLYFAFAFLVLVLCISGSLGLRALPIYKYYTGRDLMAKEESEDNLYGQANDDGDKIDPAQASVADNQVSDYQQPQMEPALRFRISSWSVFRRLIPLSIAVFLVFFVTLSLFPAISSSVRSTGQPWSDAWFQSELFTPVAFLIFSLGDWLGKALPGFPALPLPTFIFGREPTGERRRWNYAVITEPWAIFALTVARFIFIPLFLVSNTVIKVSNVDIKDRWLPQLINNDIAFYIMMALFAVSNGWLGSLAMMRGPQLVRPHEREMAGTVMVFCLTIGLAVGSMFSFFLRSSLCNWCNPFSS